MKGILGRKIGMTQVFAKNGKLTPVTVIEVEPNVVTQIKTKDKEGYEAIQLAFAEKREKLVNAPLKGHFKKAKTTPKRFLKEIKGVDITAYNVGDQVKADVFEVGEMVDVTGVSKGKGFQGVIKRHNFSRGPETHGSHHHRRPGSLGTMRAKRVFKGKKLPGQMGGAVVTMQNLQVIAIDLENNVILVKGNVPGPKKTCVLIKTAVKQPNVTKDVDELITYIETIEETNVENNEVVETTEEVVEETATKETVEAVEAEVTEAVAEEKVEEPKEEAATTEEETKEVK